MQPGCCVTVDNRDWISWIDQGIGVRPVLGTDVDPDISELRHLVALFGCQQVRRAPGNHARNCTLFAPHRQVLPQQNLHVPPTDGLHVEEAIFVHVLHHQGNLVAMPRQHDAWFFLAGGGTAGRVAHGNHIAMAVGVNLVGHWPRPLPDHLLDGLLVTGRAGSLEKLA
jgi:hypothetical protein